MKEEICKDIQNLIDKMHGDRYYAIFYYKNYGRSVKQGYLWVYKKSDHKMIMVIHGRGTKDRPYEIKLISVDEDNTVDKRFNTLSELKRYLRFKLLDDLMVYGL